ncbi:hypothetical protein VitviT2T_005014 [Vitis vinifera]|uniref:CCHC-type domain-containing protein n=1 Tax=Vitis vinifera TaxID=29760 RepID=A0ABY9BRX3_VITVI|nr:hypothetical protein VitviT2T_005014 [Vitis vinifera]
MSANFTVGGSSKDGRGCRNTHGNDRAHTRGHNSFHCSQYFGLGLGGYGRGNGLLPTCQVCGRQGHIAINCYHRFDRAFQSPPSNSLTFMVALPNTIADPSWYFDSGASTHVTNNPDNLSFKSYYNGHDKVTVGNDQGTRIHAPNHVRITTACSVHVPGRLSDGESLLKRGRTLTGGYPKPAISFQFSKTPSKWRLRRFRST